MINSIFGKNECSIAAYDILYSIENTIWEGGKQTKPLKKDFFQLKNNLEKLAVICNDETLHTKINKINNDIIIKGPVVAVYDNKFFFKKELVKKLGTIDTIRLFFFTNI